MDSNKYTLDERDVVDNKETGKWFILTMLTLIVEGRKLFRLHQSALKRGLQKDQFGMDTHQKESQATDARVEVIKDGQLTL